MKDFITLPENNGKLAVYTGRDINGIYRYLEIIGSPTVLTTSGQRSHHFGLSSSTNNDTASLQPGIAALRTRQKIICECCGRIGHKYYACIFCGLKFLLPSLRRKMNQFNDIYGDEPNELPLGWIYQPPAAHFNSSTSTPNTISVVTAITGRLKQRAINNGDVRAHTSYFLVKFNSESVPDIDTTSIK